LSNLGRVFVSAHENTQSCGAVFSYAVKRLVIKMDNTPVPSQQVRLVTDKEVARMLNVSVRHLHRMKSRGDVIRPIKIGKLTRWNLEEVEGWIRGGCPVPVVRNSKGDGCDG